MTVKPESVKITHFAIYNDRGGIFALGDDEKVYQYDTDHKRWVLYGA